MSEQSEMHEQFQHWCILEIFGHRRLFGLVTEVQIGGASFLCLNIPGETGFDATQYYSPAAVYCITPTTEEICREMAVKNKPEPVHRWELKAIEPPTKSTTYERCESCGEYLPLDGDCGCTADTYDDSFYDDEEAWARSLGREGES